MPSTAKTLSHASCLRYSRSGCTFFASVVSRLPRRKGELLWVLRLPADLGHVLVDAVEGFEHDDGVSADDDHANAHLFAAGLFF